MHLPYVTTVIAPLGEAKLSPTDLGSLCGAMERLAGTGVTMHWLAEGEACDIFHAPIHAASLKILHDQHIPFAVDSVTQPVAHRRKQLLVSDMDSTLIEQECIDELADYVGVRDRVAIITERAMNGELDFESALKERVSLLRGLPLHALQEVYDQRITLMPGAKTLLTTMKRSGAHCILVSGGFSFFTQRVRVSLGFDEDYSNELLHDGSLLSGEVAAPILGKQAKLDTLQASCARLQLPMEKSLALGDGANDLPMLLAAGLGVAYHAKPIVQQQVHAAINHHDLSALLYVQGFARHTWVTTVS